MGAEGAYIPLIAAAIMGGSGIAGQLMAGDGQQFQSFEGDPELDPTKLMGETKGLMEDYLAAVLGQAQTPYRSETTLSPLPSFSGGALPMPISVPGMDRRRLQETHPSQSFLQRRSLSGSSPELITSRVDNPPGVTAENAGSQRGTDAPTWGTGLFDRSLEALRDDDSGESSDDQAAAAIEMLMPRQTRPIPRDGRTPHINNGLRG